MGLSPQATCCAYTAGIGISVGTSALAGMAVGIGASAGATVGLIGAATYIVVGLPVQWIVGNITRTVFYGCPMQQETVEKVAHVMGVIFSIVANFAATYGVAVFAGLKLTLLGIVVLNLVSLAIFWGAVAAIAIPILCCCPR